MVPTAKTVELKVRVTPRQAEWLRALAEAEFDGNMSDAVRQAFADAKLLRIAREDYAYLARVQGLRLPTDENGMTTALETILRFRGGWIDAGSLEEAKRDGLL
jgi:hypothetical protein